MKIAVAGLGYVGLSNAVVLAQHHDVIAFDVDEHRVAQLSTGVSPIDDPELQDYLTHRPLRLSATLDRSAAYADAEFLVVATPTNYDEVTNYFDTSSVESEISEVLALNPTCAVVVKSTVPVGFTTRVRGEHPGATIIFCPEFLREGRALHDNLYPSRIVVGDTTEARPRLRRAAPGGRASTTDVPVLFTEADRGGGDQALLQHLPRPARGLLQRARHLCGDARPQHRPDHRGRRPRPPDRLALQQPLLRLRRLLPAQGHPPAPGQLPRRPAEPHQRDRRGQHDPQGLHRRRYPAPQPNDRRHLPADHEGRLRQLPESSASRA